jgi:hypothetical protein
MRAKAFGFVLLVLTFLVVAAPRRAHAYPFMIRHGYTGCGPCHIDPSGEGLLTEYGRVQSVTLLSSRYGGETDAEPGRIKDFLFGLVPTPSWLLLGGWVRDGYLVTTARGKDIDHRFLQMRGDLAALFSYDWFRAYGSIGYASHSSAPLTRDTWITSSETGINLVTREFWLGADLADHTVLVRGGRLNLPFGLRNVEHNAWVRMVTNTDINQDQQYGASVAYSRDPYRLEFMAIVGNFQVHPSEIREGGYAGYFDYALRSNLTAGLSSTITHAVQDQFLRVPATRQAHGLFARYAPVKPLVVMAEGDLLILNPGNASATTGGTGWLQFDFEPLQGLHFDVTGETVFPTAFEAGGSLGGWLTAWWFFFPHFDLRGDVIWRGGGGAITTVTYLGQINWYL